MVRINDRLLRLVADGDELKLAVRREVAEAMGTQGVDSLSKLARQVAFWDTRGWVRCEGEGDARFVAAAHDGEARAHSCAPELGWKQAWMPAPPTTPTPTAPMPTKITPPHTPTSPTSTVTTAWGAEDTDRSICTRLPMWLLSCIPTVMVEEDEDERLTRAERILRGHADPSQPRSYANALDRRRNGSLSKPRRDSMAPDPGATAPAFTPATVCSACAAFPLFEGSPLDAHDRADPRAVLLMLGQVRVVWGYDSE